MKNLKITGIFIGIIILSIIFGNVMAQTRVPGVVVGDSFKYTYTLDMNVGGLSPSSFPDIFQALIDQAKSIDWVQINITKVSGTTVTAQMLMQFENGTQQSDTGTTDVSTGQGNLTMFLIAANLNAKDQIYQGNDDAIINQTITRTYLSGARQVNREEITMNYSVTPEELEGFGIADPLQQTNSQDTYWDQQSGSLVELSYKMVTRSDLVNADISVNVALVESNVYSADSTVPEYPVTIFVIIALAVSTIVAIKLNYRLPKTNFRA